MNAKVLSHRVLYRGKIFSVTSDRVREPNGITARRDIVRHPGSVVVLAVDGAGKNARVLVERQYRYGADAYLWEIPAGRIDPGETQLAAAKRELLEETGYTARRWRKQMTYYASPGFLDETMNVFVAEGLKPGTAQPEADECIRTRFFPLRQLARMATSGRLRDGKTIAAVLAYAARA
jgi:ADP-ribose pyrophosphatase